MLPSSDEKSPQIIIELNWKSILRGLTVLILIFLTIELIKFIGLMLISILLAVTLEKMLNKLIDKGFRPRIAFFALLAVSLGILALILSMGIPALFSQMQAISENLPHVKSDLISALPNGIISTEMQKVWSNPENLIGSWSNLLLKLGGSITTFIEAFVIAVTFAFYFVLDGKRTFDWLISFFNLNAQKKLRDTSEEMKGIITAYVTGQMITSFLAFLFTAILLSALKVPAWLILAIFAGVMDIVPVVGFLLTVFAVGLMALTVSSVTAMWAVTACIFYQGLENYVIAPRVYGSTLRLSSLAVLMAIMVGGILGGIVGIVLALPIAAAYPAVERIWLKRYLGEKVVKNHKEIENRPSEMEATH